MINRARYEILAGAVDAGEATLEEIADFQAALAGEPALATEWAETHAVEAALRRSLPPVPAMPEAVRQRLHQARLAALASREVAEAKAAGANNVVAFEPRKVSRGGPPVASAKRVLPWSSWLALAACLALLAAAAVMWLGRSSARDLVALAPRGETGARKPWIVWEGKAGQAYDVWILPAEGNHVEAPALFIAQNVQSPLAFNDLRPGPAATGQMLQPDTDYRVLICLANAGRVAGVAFPFHTASDAKSLLPKPSLQAAQQLAANRPADALMVITQLPDEERGKLAARNLEEDLRRRLRHLPVPARR